MLRRQDGARLAHPQCTCRKAAKGMPGLCTRSCEDGVLACKGTATHSAAAWRETKRHGHEAVLAACSAMRNSARRRQNVPVRTSPTHGERRVQEARCTLASAAAQQQEGTRVQAYGEVSHDSPVRRLMMGASTRSWPYWRARMSDTPRRPALGRDPPRRPGGDTSHVSSKCCKAG